MKKFLVAAVGVGTAFATLSVIRAPLAILSPAAGACETTVPGCWPAAVTCVACALKPASCKFAEDYALRKNAVR